MDSIDDALGREISVGHLIAAAIDKEVKGFVFGIVTGFGKAFGKHNLYIIIKNYSGYYETYTFVKKGFNNHLLIVEPTDVFLALNNNRVANIFEIIDLAKHDGILPNDYVIGKPLKSGEDSE